MSHKLANGKKIWKGIGNINILFPLNELKEYMMVLPEVIYFKIGFLGEDCFKKNHQQGNQFQHWDVERKNITTSRKT
jgi:hypothetical protein